MLGRTSRSCKLHQQAGPDLIAAGTGPACRFSRQRKRLYVNYLRGAGSQRFSALAATWPQALQMN